MVRKFISRNGLISCVGIKPAGYQILYLIEKLKNPLWAGKTIIVSCPFLFLFIGSANALCSVPGIPGKIESLIQNSAEFQTRPKSGKWVALDQVISETDLEVAYDCISSVMLDYYQLSNLNVSYKYRDWTKVNDISFYAPANDFGWANIYVNDKAKKYAANKYISDFEIGGIIVKESFTFDIKGGVDSGPLFFMEKMKPGYNPSSNDWKFVEVNLDGSFSETGGQNSELTQRCIQCHKRRKQSDFLFFIKDSK